VTRLLAALAMALALAGCHGVHSMAPKVKVGDAAPRSQNKTVAPGGNWREASTMDRNVPFYRWRIADLVSQGKPFLVVFGTPQHCTICVDQLARVAVLEEKYGQRFAFVHVDGYKDMPVWVEWGIQGEPWTFVVDAKGRVASVFPGQTDIAVLEREVSRAMNGAG
jgi:thiol-disulfide isomerase/thioredoxin